MVVSNKGHVEIKGNKNEVMADLICIIRVLKSEAKFTDEDIATVIEQSHKSYDEIKAEFDEQFRQQFPILAAFFDALDAYVENKEE